MNFSESTPHTVPRFLGLATDDAPIHYPMGIATLCKNTRFTMESVGTRYGLQNTMQTTGKDEKILGLGMLNFIGETDADVPLVFSDQGQLLKESPVGSGTLVPLAPVASLESPTAGAYAQFAFAYNSGFMAFTDLTKGLNYPAVYHAPTDTWDPVSCRPNGEAFETNGKYVVGNIVSPTTPNAHLYRVKVAGTAAAEPVWPLGAGDEITSGGVTFKEQTPSATSSAAAGNICLGLRYFVVLFRMRSGEIVAANKGYISGYRDPAILSVNVVAASKQITLSDVWIGPANCVERIIAFGQAADPAEVSSRLKYIPDDDQTGVTITKTVIPNNTDTTATFNFDDNYLGQMTGTETDVSDWYLKLRVPPCRDAAYLPSLDAMAYTCAVGYESDVLITPRADPETIFATKSNASVAAQDGDRAVCTRELPNGQILTWKDNSVHALNPESTIDPSGWNTTLKSKRAGACGPRAVDVGTEFSIFAHQSGLWRHDHNSGGFDKVTDEIQPNWDKDIDWSQKEKIWVHINETAKVIRVGAPVGGSMKVATLDYRMGWQKCVYITMFGKLAAAHEARKWSLWDDIPATCAVTAERSLVTPVDSRVDTQQVLYGCSNPEGTVRMEVPELAHDDDKDGQPVAIDHQYRSSFAQDASGKVMKLHGCVTALTGAGQVDLTPVTEDGEAANSGVHTYDLGADANETHIPDGARGDNEYWAYLFTNGNRVDNWFELHELTIYAKPFYSARRG